MGDLVDFETGFEKAPVDNAGNEAVYTHKVKLNSVNQVFHLFFSQINLFTSDIVS